MIIFHTLVSLAIYNNKASKTNKKFRYHFLFLFVLRMLISTSQVLDLITFQIFWLGLVQLDMFQASTHDQLDSLQESGGSKQLTIFFPGVHVVWW